MTKRTRRKINRALKAKIAVEALREQATVADRAQRYQVRPNQIFAGEEAASAVSAAIGQILKAFTPQECANYFQNAGYAPT